MSDQLSPEDVVRKFFDCYSNGRPQDFDEVVAPDYLDYGHTPPGRGPDGARADYETAVKHVGGVIQYTIDALVVDGALLRAERAAIGKPGDYRSPMLATHPHNYLKTPDKTAQTTGCAIPL